MNKQGVFSLLALAVIALGQAAPTNLTLDAHHTTTAPTNGPVTDTKISALKVSAIQETYAVLTEIHELEKHTVRSLHIRIVQLLLLSTYRVATICTNTATSLNICMYVYINRRRHTIYPTKTALYDLSQPML